MSPRDPANGELEKLKMPPPVPVVAVAALP